VDVPNGMVHENIEDMCGSNMARLEASMAEGYICDECLGFVTEYLQSFEVVQRRVWDVDDKEGDVGEVVKGVGTKFVMSPTLRDLAHQCVLTNISIMTPLME